MSLPEFLRTVRESFPKLREHNCRLTSPPDTRYNCIGWAAEDAARWWWPDPLGQYYWPVDATRAESLGAFEAVFREIGYAELSDSSFEAEKLKVAIYVDARGSPTHAARQVANGWWTSKLGQQVDIEHELHALEGPVYGRVGVVLAKDL